jgi:hypothetical protein
MPRRLQKIAVGFAIPGACEFRDERSSALVHDVYMPAGLDKGDTVRLRRGLNVGNDHLASPVEMRQGKFSDPFMDVCATLQTAYADGGNHPVMQQCVDYRAHFAEATVDRQARPALERPSRIGLGKL